MKKIKKMSSRIFRIINNTINNNNYNKKTIIRIFSSCILNIKGFKKKTTEWGNTMGSCKICWKKKKVSAFFRVRKMKNFKSKFSLFRLSIVISQGTV